MKNEMYYGSEKEYTSFKVFAKAVKEYIHYFNKERIQKKTKWNASRNISGNIH